MHTLEPRFCIPKLLCGESAPVSTQFVFTICCTRRCIVPLGFFVVAFPPPPVTCPATRLSIFRRERRSTRSADHFRGALLVFIRVTGKIFRSFPQAFRLRRLAFLSSGFPLLLLPNVASPRSFHFQLPV